MRDVCASPNFGGWFVGEALQAFLTGMGGTQVGIIGFASMLAVIIATVFMFIKTVLKLITHLADRAPQWIGGHSGQGLGEAEIAQGAVDHAGRGAAEYGMYAGEKLDAIGNGMVKSGADRTKAAAEQQQEGQNTGLNPGKAAGQDKERLR
ncbi:hypothetical protein [Acidithiobacillus sp.]